MPDLNFSRRKFIQRTIEFGAAILGIGFMGGCGREEEVEQTGFTESCDDLSNVSQSEIDKRDLYGYVEETPYPANRCDNCNLYIPPEEDERCGGCVLFKGPVFAAGYCDYWEPES